MQVQSLGHVVLKVTDLEKSEKFYGDMLGMPVCARFNEQGMNMIFFSLGNHHELALAEVSGEENTGGAQAAGLHHVAFCIGNDMAQLIEAKGQLDAAGVSCMPIDHDVTKSLYFDDPDGNTVELYVDVSEAWRDEPQRIAAIQPLEL